MSKAQTVSIIDDDASVRIAMEGLVRSAGFIAFVFESAEDFLRSPRVNDSACLITDVQMPGMSGLDLQDRLIAQGGRIPIIFITAFPEQDMRRRAQTAGAIAFLEKPFDGGDDDKVAARSPRGAVSLHGRIRVANRASAANSEAPHSPVLSEIRCGHPQK